MRFYFHAGMDLKSEQERRSSGFEIDHRSVLICKDESRTIQSQAEEADINTIVKRFGLTGELPTNIRVPLEADFVDVIDYQSAMNAMLQADKSFMAMPADVRKRFDNDPALFVDFCMNPENLDEMRKLGLAVPAKQEDTTPVPSPSPSPPVE